MSSLSIRTRLTLYVGAFMALLLAVIVAAGWSLIHIDRRTQDIAGTWLAETRLLGELSDSLSEFRLGELSYATARKAEARQSALEDIAQHRETIDETLAAVGALRASVKDDDAEADARLLDSIATDWRNYLAAHELWVKSADMPDFFDTDAAGAKLRRLYLRLDNAIDTLSADNKRHTDGDAAEARLLARDTLRVMALVAVVALTMGALLIWGKQKRIFIPLQQVTDALSRLAAGDRDVPAPDYRGDNEIGALIRAFNAFRANVFELERAHEETRIAQEQAETLASQDPLTGLANRRIVVAQLQHLVSRARDGLSQCALFIIDLDRFKPINDLMGHAVGDLVLCEMAKRLTTAVRRGDIAARLGGDEFAVIVELDLAQRIDDALELGDRIRAALCAPIPWGEGELQVGASIGVASTLTLEADSGGLLRAADIAMYRAKRDSERGVCLFHPSMDAELKENAYLEEALRRAIVNDRIQPFYQPLVSLADGKIFGFEILSRWRDPQFGEVAPDIFIPIAERLGLIPLLTSFVLRQACRDAAQWPDHIQLSLNISALQLKDVKQHRIISR